MGRTVWSVQQTPSEAQGHEFPQVVPESRVVYGFRFTCDGGWRLGLWEVTRVSSSGQDQRSPKEGGTYSVRLSLPLHAWHLCLGLPASKS